MFFFRMLYCIVCFSSATFALVSLIIGRQLVELCVFLATCHWQILFIYVYLLANKLIDLLHVLFLDLNRFYCLQRMFSWLPARSFVHMHVLLLILPFVPLLYSLLSTLLFVTCFSINTRYTMLGLSLQGNKQYFWDWFPSCRIACRLRSSWWSNWPVLLLLKVVQNTTF